MAAPDVIKCYDIEKNAIIFFNFYLDINVTFYSQHIVLI